MTDEAVHTIVWKQMIFKDYCFGGETAATRGRGRRSRPKNVTHKRREDSSLLLRPEQIEF